MLQCGFLDMLPEGQSRKFEIKRMRAIGQKNESSFKTCGKTREAIKRLTVSPVY